MRLAPNDEAPERGLLTKEELLETPTLGAEERSFVAFLGGFSMVLHLIYGSEWKFWT